MHQILRQIVDVDVRGGEEVGLEVQRQVSDVCRRAVGAHLEGALAPFDADDRYLVIDRLDVDLGDVRLEHLESALTTSLSTAVAATLRERGVTPLPRGSTATTGLRAFTADEALLAGVLHFLRHGRLPWWYVSADPRPLDERMLALLSPDGAVARPPGRDASRPSASGGAFIVDLLRMLRSDSRARERLRRQFSTASVVKLLELIDAGAHGRLLEAVRSVRRSALSGEMRDRLEAGLVDVAIDAIAREAPPASDGDLLRRAAMRLAPRLSGDERERLAAGVGFDVPVDLEHPSPAPALHLAADDEAATEGLLVDDAGVVLLHPFLPRFFGALGVAVDDALVRPARAALLLHHLATGALAAEEHDLVLAKVLCGIPIESPVPREAPVTAEEQAEATALLDSVVRHWEVLRNTTADGLRGNFLARRGRIELREDDWVLRLELRPYDLLLDSLPWGIAHVKLPWMPRLMHVEWAA